MQAADLLQKGLSQSEVARQVGAHRQSVSQWAAGFFSCAVEKSPFPRVRPQPHLEIDEARRLRTQSDEFNSDIRQHNDSSVNSDDE
jgi:transcriptional regulator with XRE-family HTH domain